MKAIRGIGKGATALSDFFASINISHCSLHHKTYRGHMGMMVHIYISRTADYEATSVVQIKELYKGFINPPRNIDVIFDGTWLTCGHSLHVAVGCIIEMYSGLVVDHIVLSNFCLGCSNEPKPNQLEYSTQLGLQNMLQSAKRTLTVKLGKRWCQLHCACFKAHLTSISCAIQQCYFMGTAVPFMP